MKSSTFSGNDGECPRSVRRPTIGLISDGGAFLSPPDLRSDSLLAPIESVQLLLFQLLKLQLLLRMAMQVMVVHETPLIKGRRHDGRIDRQSAQVHAKAETAATAVETIDGGW